MTEKRFTTIYNEQSKMMQYVDNHKEKPNKWAIWNANETAQKLNELNDENEQLKQLLDEAEDIIMCQCTPHYQRQWENIKKNLKGDVE